jgi:hypothetical protein
MTFNPVNHDFLATSLSTDTILSWRIKATEQAIRSESILYGVKQIPGGIDSSQLAMNLNRDRLYIANPTLNAVKVENGTNLF